MRYLANEKCFTTDAGKPMARFSKVVRLMISHAEADPFKDKLDEPENKRLITGIKMSVAEEAEGFTKEEFAVEVLSDAIGRLMSNLAIVVTEHTPESMDDPLAQLSFRNVTALTVCGIALTSAVCKGEKKKATK